MIARDRASVGVLVTAVPAEVVDEAVARHGVGARRSDGKLPPAVVAYLEMGLWLFPEDDYVEAATKVTGVLDELGTWSAPWSVPTSSGITQARKRLGPAVMVDVFERVALPLAGPLTPGAWLGTFPGPTWRMVAIDGFDLDLPDTPGNVEAFGRAGTATATSSTSSTSSGGEGGSAFPKARVLTLTECATHAPIAAAVGAWDVGERTLARDLYPQLSGEDVVIADRGFYSYDALSQVVDAGAQAIFRLSASVGLPLVAVLGDGSYTSVVHPPTLRSATRRQQVLARARAGQQLDPDTEGRLVRVVEYDITDRPDTSPHAGTGGEGAADGEGSGELVVLLSTFTQADPTRGGVSAIGLAAAYAQRWEHETSIDQAKDTIAGGAHRVLRSRLPDLVVQEIYGLLLTQYALAALAYRAAQAAGVDPDRVSLARTLRIARRSATGTAGFPP